MRCKFFLSVKSLAGFIISLLQRGEQKATKIKILIIKYIML